MIKMYSGLLVVILSAFLAIGCTTLTTEDNFDSGKENFMAGNFDQSFKQLLPLAKQGNHEAEYAVGYMYFYGLGTQQDMQQAIKWMQQAADAGQPQAKVALQQLQQDHVITTKAFSNDINRTDYYQNSSGQGGGSSDRSKDVPNQITATWPKPAGVTPAPQIIAPAPAPAPINNQVNDIHSSAEPNEISAKIAENTVVQELPKNNSAHYAVQLMGAYSQNELQKFAQELSIAPEEYQIVETQRGDRNWYILAYGSYPDRETALMARAELPEELQELKPWVRDLDQVRDVA